MRRSRCTRPNVSVSGVATIRPGYGLRVKVTSAARSSTSTPSPAATPSTVGQHRQPVGRRGGGELVAALRADRRDAHVRPVEGGADPQEVGLAVGPPGHGRRRRPPGRAGGRGRRGRPSGAARAGPAARRTRTTRPGCRAGRGSGCRRARRARTAWPGGWRSASSPSSRCGRAPPSPRRPRPCSRRRSSPARRSAAAPSRRRASSTASSSGTRPRSIGSAPAAATRATSIGRFESRIWPRASGSPGGTSSSPVDSRPTRGRGTTVTSVRPTLASTPRWVGRSSVPAGTTTSPTCTSSPAPRTAVPGLTSSVSSTSSGPAGRLRSTITTASAPSGIGAPVMIRIASPGPTGRSGAIPAIRVATTRSAGGRGLARPGGVGGLHREAVHRRVHERRHRFERRDRLRGDAPDGVGQRHRPRRQPLARRQHRGLRLTERDHARNATTRPDSACGCRRSGRRLHAEPSGRPGTP